jgi:hypothetical protein
MSIAIDPSESDAGSVHNSMPSPAQTMDIAREREASLSRLLMAYVS